ncbi:unnamed protein product [Macrosiphum euphorbiae]|uniref:Uncharacterized protein n=1 Tax=Macrosiphum euphorbiae TaxID=13131 RepID=A0AAV0XWZ4_9HEMI|nr:unnamed protein product [Macrosiphum euphorbiae]
MRKPTPEQWLGIADRFYQNTNFPNCLCAIDGKYIRCRNPISSGSYYFNYKKCSQEQEERLSVHLEYYPTNGEDGASYEYMESNLFVFDLEILGAPAREQGIEVRAAYVDYFMGLGSIPFQYIIFI